MTVCSNNYEHERRMINVIAIAVVMDAAYQTTAHFYLGDHDDPSVSIYKNGTQLESMPRDPTRPPGRQKPGHEPGASPQICWGQRSRKTFCLTPPSPTECRCTRQQLLQTPKKRHLESPHPYIEIATVISDKHNIKTSRNIKWLKNASFTPQTISIHCNFSPCQSLHRYRYCDLWYRIEWRQC